MHQIDVANSSCQRADVDNAALLRRLSYAYTYGTFSDCHCKPR